MSDAASRSDAILDRLLYIHPKGIDLKLERIELTASRVNWIAGTPPAAGSRVTARIRHRHQEAPATITPLPGDRVRVTFDEPQYAVAPGQAVVMYEREIVIGGGWID